MTVMARPLNAVWCSCPQGWHVSFTAHARCPNRPENAHLRALSNTKPKRRRAR